jgi:DNA polymerase
MKDLYGTNIVLGEGPIPCDVFMCGEAPGQDEDLQGKPFCGKAGRMLTSLLKKFTDMNRDQVYITNAVKQRPPNNRKPTFSEIMEHRPMLLAEIKTIKPKIIVTLGKTALQALYGKDLQNPLYTYRNRKITFKGSKVIPTYHPAVLFRSNSYIVEIRSDLFTLKNLIHELRND